MLLSTVRGKGEDEIKQKDWKMDEESWIPISMYNENRREEKFERTSKSTCLVKPAPATVKFHGDL